MICPVNMVDHESSLIAADWYEENGDIHYAEQIRQIDTPKCIYIRGIYSRVGSQRHNNWHISLCKTTNVTHHKSRCCARIVGHFISVSQSRTRRGHGMSGYRTSKGRIVR